MVHRQPNALWRIVMVFIAVTLVWYVVAWAGEAAFGPDYNRLGHIMRAVLASALAVPTITLARRFLDRRSWVGLGLLSPRTCWRPLLFGMACWLIPAGIGIAACVAFGWTDITLRTSLGEVLLLTAGLVLLVFLYEALPEELVFRGYFYRNLVIDLPRWLAVLAQAVLFTLWGLAIGATGSVDRIIAFFVFAVVLGMFRAVTGNIWAGIGFHTSRSRPSRNSSSVAIRISSPLTRPRRCSSSHSRRCRSLSAS